MIESVLIGLFVILVIGVIYAAWKLLADVKTDIQKTKEVSIDVAEKAVVVSRKAGDLLLKVWGFIKARIDKKQEAARLKRSDALDQLQVLRQQREDLTRKRTEAINKRTDERPVFLENKDGIYWREVEDLPDSRRIQNQLAGYSQQYENAQEYIVNNTSFRDKQEAEIFAEAERQMKNSMKLMENKNKIYNQASAQRQQALRKKLEQTEKGLDEIFRDKFFK